MKKKLHYLIIALAFGFSLNAQVSITGNGTGGWNQPGNLALTNTPVGSTIWTATNFEIINDGQMKFSEAGTWGTTYGFTGANVAPFGFPSGTANVAGGNNIVGTLGFWSVTYNTATKEYSFTAGVNPNAVIKISGGGLAADVQMNTANGTAYSKKSVFFPGGTASFIQDGTANKWGGAFPDETAASLGGTIAVTTGAYNVYFVKNTAAPNEYIFEPVVVSMIGNFTGSGWGTDVDLVTSDNINYTKSNWVASLAGGTDTECHFKIRDNHDWSTQYGESTGTNGGNGVTVSGVTTYSLTGTSKNGISGGGGDIFIPWGTYNVNFNRSTGTWTFTKVLGTTKFAGSNFKVYPNPTSNNWSFSSANNQIESVQIIDITGKVVLTSKTDSNDVNVDVSRLNSGVYFAKISSANATETVKLVKK